MVNYDDTSNLMKTRTFQISRSGFVLSLRPRFSGVWGGAAGDKTVSTVSLRPGKLLKQLRPLAPLRTPLKPSVNVKPGVARNLILKPASLPLHAGPEAGHAVKAQSRSAAAFTLTEIMVVLIVIGIIAAAIVPQFIGTTQDAKVSSAKGSVTELESAVDRFYYNMDRYPTTEEGLKVLVEAPTGEETKWRGPYIKMLRNDPWGNPYQYRSPGTHHTSGFDLWSRGADGVDGGEGQNADIGNWQ
jgi:general secretion pathway protein G